MQAQNHSIHPAKVCQFLGIPLLRLPHGLALASLTCLELSGPPLPEV